MTTQFQPDRIVGGRSNAQRAKAAVEPLLMYGRTTRCREHLVTLVSDLLADITHLAAAAGHDPDEFMTEVFDQAEVSYNMEAVTEPHENDSEPPYLEEPWFQSSDEGTDFFEWAKRLPSIDPVAHMDEVSLAEVACCIWEEVLERQKRKCGILDTLVQDLGSSQLRMTLASPDMVRACETSWRAVDYPDSFDWEFVPAWLEIMLTRYVSTLTGEVAIPTIDTLKAIGREIAGTNTPQ